MKRRWIPTSRLYLCPSVFRRRLLSLFRQPIFVFITLWGHGSILLGSIVFYHYEYGNNPRIQSLLDTLTWAIGTVTTVGSGDIIPVTTGGRVVSILMMILGSLFLWSYTGLFAGALVAPEIRILEKDVKGLEKNVHAFEKELIKDEKSIHQLLLQIEAITQELKNKIEKRN